MRNLLKLNFILTTLFLLSLLIADTAFAQTLGQGEAFEPPIFRLIFGLVLCTLLAFLAALMIKKQKTSGNKVTFKSLLQKQGLMNSTAINVIETHRINQHADICIIECAGKQFHIIVSQQYCEIINTTDIDEINSGSANE